MCHMHSSELNLSDILGYDHINCMFLVIFQNVFVAISSGISTMVQNYTHMIARFCFCSIEDYLKQYCTRIRTVKVLSLHQILMLFWVETSKDYLLQCVISVQQSLCIATASYVLMTYSQHRPASINKHHAEWGVPASADS